MPAKMPELPLHASTRRRNAIREKRQPAVPGSDARNAVAVICAIYEAAKTGRTVQVK